MSRFQGKYPKGSIKHREEILDIIQQSKQENININLYGVEQSGYISTYIITPNSLLKKNDIKGCEEPSFDQITCYATYNYLEPSKWLWYYILLGSYNIDNLTSNKHGVHRLFSNKEIAKDYSKELKNDKEYLQEVKEHHNLCNRLFNRLDRLFGD